MLLRGDLARKVYAIRDRMGGRDRVLEEAIVHSRYRQEPLGEGRVRFTVSPAPIPARFGLPAGLAAVVAAPVLATTPPHEAASMVAIRVAIAAAGAWGIHRLSSVWLTRTADRARSPGGTFVISPSAIELADGLRIPRARVRRLVVRNGLPNVADPVVVPPGDVFERGAGSEGAAQRGGVAQVSFLLCAEADDASHTLAGGMTERTAHGLLIDVSRILSLGA